MIVFNSQNECQSYVNISFMSNSKSLHILATFFGLWILMAHGFGGCDGFSLILIAHGLGGCDGFSLIIKFLRFTKTQSFRKSESKNSVAGTVFVFFKLLLRPERDPSV